MKFTICIASVLVAISVVSAIPVPNDDDVSGYERGALGHEAFKELQIPSTSASSASTKHEKFGKQAVFDSSYAEGEQGTDGETFDPDLESSAQEFGKGQTDSLTSLPEVQDSPLSFDSADDQEKAKEEEFPELAADQLDGEVGDMGTDGMKSTMSEDRPYREDQMPDKPLLVPSYQDATAQLNEQYQQEVAQPSSINGERPGNQADDEEGDDTLKSQENGNARQVGLNEFWGSGDLDATLPGQNPDNFQPMSRNFETDEGLSPFQRFEAKKDLKYNQNPQFGADGETQESEGDSIAPADAQEDEVVDGFTQDGDQTDMYEAAFSGHPPQVGKGVFGLGGRFKEEYAAV